MSTLTTAPEVTRYLEEVRRHLADLSAEERDGLLEDLEDHLAEVAAEYGLPLERRLGQPAAFAAELRASAGLDGPGPEAGAAGRRWRPVRSLAGSLAASPTWQRVRAFLPELQPGWWVLRGYLAVAVLSVIADGRSGLSSFPVPSLGGSAFLGLVAVALAVPASVALGRRALAATEGRGRWLDRAATALVVVGCLGSLGTVQPASSGPWYPVETHYSGAGGGGSALHDAEGRPITNIYAYDAEGRLLDGVYLYDQAGRPLDDVSPVTEDGLPVETNYRLDANGAPIGNAYPLDVRVPVAPDRSRNGQPGFRPFGTLPMEPQRPPAVVVPPAAPTTTSTTTAAATTPTTAG